MSKASVLVIVLIPLCCRTSGFKFIKPEPTEPISAILGDSQNLNCTTTDPNATTSLWFKSGLTFQQLKVDDVKVFRVGAVYTLKDLVLLDQGLYQCRATNSLGVSISWSGAPLFFSKPSTPDVKASPKSLKIAAGENANFTCQADTKGRTQFNLAWSKQLNKGSKVYSPVPSSQEYREASDTLVLMITKASASGRREDLYRCQLKYDVSKEKNVYVRLTVRDLTVPIVKYFPSAPVTMDESTAWSAACTVEGFPLPNITWLEDGKALPVCHIKGGCNPSDNFVTNATVLGKWTLKSELTVRSVQRPSGSNTRNYTCLAMNSVGSTSQSLQVIIQGKPILKRAIKNFLSTSRVYCEVEPVQPLPTIRWEYEPWGCSNHESMCHPQQRWKTLPDDHIVSPFPTEETLYSEVTVPGRIEEGFYKCIAKNALGKDSQSVLFRRHVVLIETERTVLNAQETLVIRCVYREAKFAGWTKDGVQLSANLDQRLNVSQTHALTVFNLTVNDSGVYSCLSEMPRGNASVQITVRELQAPEISSFPNQTVFRGNLSVILYCNVSANPVASVTWTKDGQSVTIIPVQTAVTVDCQSRVNGYYRAERGPNTLVICEPNDSANSGRFTCTARNGLGTSSQDAYVNVQELAVAEIVDAPTTDTMEVTLGQPVYLICRGRGNPAPLVRWFKLEEGRIDVSHKPDGSTNATLRIEAVEGAHRGNYICSAENFLRKSEVHLQIELIELEPTAGPRSDLLMIGLVSGFGAFLVIAILVIVLICRNQKKQIAEYRSIYFGQGSDYQFDPKRTLLEQSSDLAYDPDWEFPEERLLLGDVLDSGNFGLVYIAEAIGIMTFDARNKSLAAFKRRSTLRKRVKSPTKIEKDEKGQQYNRTTVAVKTLKADATTSDYKDLVSELKIMIHVGQHKNIINLLGACTRGKRLMLIIEFAPHGSLIKFLRKKREIFQPTWLKETTSPETEFTIADLAMEAYQVARGLEYLASNKCVHRDVAARNVLIAEGYVLKVSDFGLARDVHQDDEYVKTTTGALPVKWMALESIISRVYSEKSDVWSFGVLLWELFTLGGVPYNKIPTGSLIDAIAGGHRLECPLDCPVEMYTLMGDCWLEAPDRRPTFTHIVDRLGQILEKSAAKASTEYISFLNDGLPNDYYLRPVDSGPRVTNGAAPPLSPRDKAVDFAHEPLPPIPGSESADHDREPDERDRAPDERDRALDERDRAPDDKGTARFSSVSVENESGIGLDDSAGESGKLVPGSDEQRAKVNRKNNVVVGQPISPSKNSLEPRYSHGSHERMETAV